MTQPQPGYQRPWRDGKSFGRTVRPESWETCLTEDMTGGELPGTGYRFFLRFTGRTRRQWGVDMHVLEAFTITTEVTQDADGRYVIVAGIGERIPGTFGIRPEYVTFL